MYELGQHFTIPDLSRHLYVIGRSGSGKTVLLENLARQLNGGFALLDPHGDSAQRCLDFLDPNQTIYFNAGDLSHSIGWNPLQDIAPDDHYLVASQIVLSLKAIFGDSWGPRMEYILLASVMLLLARKGSLVQLPRLLNEKAFRDQITRKMSLDPFLREVWVTEFANKDKRWWEEAISPIQNKIGIIMLSPHLRQVLGQPSTINLRHIMDAGKVLVCNLAKGQLGMASNLLGSLLVSAFYRAAESRIDTPEEDRRPFTLVVDEFQNFATDSFEDILSESRKWKLQLVASHQTLSQLSPELQDAVLANVGTLVAFRIGGKDARRLADEFVFTRPLSPSDEIKQDAWSSLVATPNFHAWMKDHQGKTTLLHALLTEDLKLVAQGKASLILIDSKSELIDPIQSLKLFAPGEPLHGRLVVIEPDIHHPVAINPFKLSGAISDRNRQLGLDIQSMEFIKDAFSTITETPFSGKQEICFLNLLAVLREIPGSNIQTLKDLLSGQYGTYQNYLDRLEGDTRHFWDKQFNGREAIYKSTKEEIGYRLDGMLIKSPMLKAILSSPVTRLDLNAEIEQGKVIIINTSQALLGVDGSCLFGRLFIAMIQQIAERRFLPGANKLPTFCYIDECGDYLKKEAKFAPILNRCRAANIGMILAHQDLSQISADVFSALSNAGIQMVNTYADAPAFARPMRCEPAFLNKATGQFAAMLRDARSLPVTIHVPEVDFRKAPRMSADERRILWAEMHQRYCRSTAQEAPFPAEAPPSREDDLEGPAKTASASDDRYAKADDPPSEDADVGPSTDY